LLLYYTSPCCRTTCNLLLDYKMATASPHDSSEKDFALESDEDGLPAVFQPGSVNTRHADSSSDEEYHPIPRVDPDSFFLNVSFSLCIVYSVSYHVSLMSISTLSDAAST
jgi:hypothetical protein